MTIRPSLPCSASSAEEVADPSVVAHLRRARDLLAPRGQWTREAYARDRNGAAVDTWNPDAVCFCCSGAMFATQRGGSATLVASRALLSTAIQADIETWNDTPGRCQTEVIAAFDRAIDIARSRSQT